VEVWPYFPDCKVGKIYFQFSLFDYLMPLIINQSKTIPETLALMVVQSLAGWLPVVCLKSLGRRLATLFSYCGVFIIYQSGFLQKLICRTAAECMSDPVL
jgi:hypothetical protein